MSLTSDFIPDLVVHSPGRVNLIGEHTDYNYGFVLPTAIDKRITISLRKNFTSEECHIWSKDTNKKTTIKLSALFPSEVSWENYILGVLYELCARTDALKGFDCTIESNLPIGAGLSSSAALECGLAYGLTKLFSLPISKEEIVKLCQAAEHNFVGTKCGIMDQYASVMSKTNKVIFLDCKSVEAEYLPLHLGDYKLLLLNTNVSHSLADSEYNTRLEECNLAVKACQVKHPDVQSLRDVTIELLNSLKNEMDPVIFDRATYVIEENNRVIQAVKALKNSNLLELGTLMYQSHRGLRYLYNVSCKELDFLVDYSKKKSAFIGSRMMGGGFGGCTINLIHKDAIDDIIPEISEVYQMRFGKPLDAYVTLPSSGTSYVKIKQQQL